MPLQSTELVECGAVPIDRFEIGRRRRHLHEIAGRVVVGAGTADAEIRASGGDQRLCLRLDLTGRRRDHQSSDALRQAVALVRVEDGKALEKRDGARLLARFRGAPTFVVRGEAIGIDDGGSPFALPDMAAEPERLAKGEPALSGEAALDDGTPQDQHVDPGISALRRRVARHRERRLDRRRPPWLHPGDTAAIKAPLAMPRNASTQRGYSGINVLILWGAVIEHGFSGQSWLTFRQALGLGGHVRKGERGTTVVYADRFTPDDERRRAAEAGEEPGAIPFLKRFTVFNTDQCDGLPEERRCFGRPAAARSDRAASRGVDRRHRRGFPHRRCARLLQHGGRFRAGAAAGGLFRTDQLAPDRIP